LDPPQRSTFQHKYYIVGDFNHWTWQELQEDDSSYVAEIACIKDACAFQIVRDKDWDQSFHPKYPKLHSTKNSCSDCDIGGPDGDSLGNNWVLPNKAGDVYEIRFSRNVKDDGEDTTKSLSWRFLRTSATDSVQLAKSQTYTILISSQKYQKLNPMIYAEQSETWRGCFQIGASGREKMIILMNKNWLSAIHPNADNAHYLDADHSVQGPDTGGDKKHWLVGSAKDLLLPGEMVQVDMKVENGVPTHIRWSKLSAFFG
jgi:hypothetical protein